MAITVHIRFAVITTIFLLTAGCKSTDPVRVEEDFGKSVRQMVEAQIYDPDAARNPPADPPLQLEGQKAEAGLQSYREDVPDPAEVQQPLIIQIDN